MILEFDLGNSRAKWRLRGGSAAAGGSDILQRGSCAIADFPAGDTLAALPAAIERALAGSVAGPEVDARLAASIRQRFGLEVEFAHTGAECGGVRNAYREWQRLGVDRWLAMIAARHHARAQGGAGGVMVVDAGSALTLDALAADGRHLGGYIIPGLDMMHRSLTGATHGVSVAPGGASARCGPGCSTEEAVVRGALLAAAASVERAWDEYQALGADLQIAFITGGNGAEVLEALRHSDGRWELRSDLVLDGLQLALG